MAAVAIFWKSVALLESTDSMWAFLHFVNESVHIIGDSIMFIFVIFVWAHLSFIT